MIGVRMRKCQHGQFAVTDLPQDATSGPACGGVDKHVADQVNIDEVSGKPISCQTLGLISRITHPLRWNQHAIHAYDDLGLISGEYSSHAI